MRRNEIEQNIRFNKRYNGGWEGTIDLSDGYTLTYVCLASTPARVAKREIKEHFNDYVPKLMAKRGLKFDEDK